ncbi:hypothetical protein [Demequina litorisediminis]|uniref:Uncharacterized protein n=1 Tax=Demequina litorisediminis TaxID=1849022 RepID=A0ABQ6IBA2_9MICO|nr:hypothetical protein [Demequina litorisediminis]GMA34731.1 hypothetical protein GCM10025876_09350 [Demequina litorisediminis]
MYASDFFKTGDAVRVALAAPDVAETTGRLLSIDNYGVTLLLDGPPVVRFFPFASVAHMDGSEASDVRGRAIGALK